MSDAPTLVMSNKEGVHALVMAAHHFGVAHVVICPGSRNAPFTISFNRSGLFHCHSIPDERVAAFYALGMALATGKPVVVVCTSGSAGINLGPAIAEAFYLNAPLIAITADRPLAWTDQGNGQTIRQEGLFNNYIRGSYSLIEHPTTRDEVWRNRREISTLFNRMLTHAPGPIHFNAPLSEPLYHTASYLPTSMPLYYRRVGLTANLDAEEAARFRSAFAEAPKVMLLLGQMPAQPQLAHAIARLAALPHVVVLTETTSNMASESVISTIDRLIMPVQDAGMLQQLMPDVLITIGGMVVSKKIKSLLREYAPTAHWHVNPTDEGLDTYMSLTEEVPCAPLPFLENLLSASKPTASSPYAAQWKQLQAGAQKGHDAYMPLMPWSDFKAFEVLLAGLPGGLVLHMANSSAVRYVQLFGARVGTTYHANRGTSGIDGSTSTAAGWAKAHPHEQVVLITGDTAFMYDSNALWNNALPQNMKVVMVNNEGGGIFRIIDGPAATEELEPFFEAHHPAHIERIAAAFDLPHYHAADEATLTNVLPKFLATKGFALLEVRTPATVNAPVLKQYFRHIATHLSDAGLVQGADAAK